MTYYSETIQPIAEPLGSAHDYHHKYEDEEGSNDRKKKPSKHSMGGPDASNRARAHFLKEKLAQQQELINNAMMTE